MAVQTVFSSNLDPASENLTARFLNATAFYIDAPLITADLEIDVFLQVYFPVGASERVRNLPLGKVEEQAILLNVTDTQSVVTIPNEYVDSGLEMALLFLASYSTFLEVYVLGRDCTLCQIKAQNTAIKSQLDDMQNTLAQILTAVSTPTVPIPLGISGMAQQFFFMQ